mgnify:CR=1 FL=1
MQEFLDGGGFDGWPSVDAHVEGEFEEATDQTIFEESIQEVFSLWDDHCSCDFPPLAFWLRSVVWWSCVGVGIGASVLSPNDRGSLIRSCSSGFRWVSGASRPSSPLAFGGHFRGKAQSLVGDGGGTHHTRGSTTGGPPTWPEGHSTRRGCLVGDTSIVAPVCRDATAGV